MNTINESEPQYLDMMHADISGTSDISWSGAAQGIGHDLVETGKQIAPAIIPVTIASASRHLAGGPDLGFNISADFVGYAPGLVVISLGLLGGAIHAHDLLHSRKYMQQIKDNNDDVHDRVSSAISNQLKTMKKENALPPIPVDDKRKPKYANVEEQVEALHAENLKKALVNHPNMLEPIHRKTITVDEGGRQVNKDVWDWQAELNMMLTAGFSWGLSIGLIGMAISDFLLWTAGVPGINTARIVSNDFPLATLALVSFAKFRPEEEIWKRTLKN